MREARRSSGGDGDAHDINCIPRIHTQSSLGAVVDEHPRKDSGIGNSSAPNGSSQIVFGNCHVMGVQEDAEEAPAAARQSNFCFGGTGICGRRGLSAGPSNALSFRGGWWPGKG